MLDIINCLRDKTVNYKSKLQKYSALMKGSEKITMLLSHFELNTNQFAKSIGLKRAQAIYDILNEKVEISKKMASKILNVYPDINKSWLLADSDKMLITPEGIEYTLSEIDAAKAYAKKDPLRNKNGEEWAVLRLLRHEVASLRAEATKRSFQDCLDELNDKVQVILQK